MSRSSGPIYDNELIKRTLDDKYVTPYLKQAQWAELADLKRIVGDEYKDHKRLLKVFDIGVGTARVPLLLSEVETWGKIKLYTGIDSSKICKSIGEKQIKNKINIRDEKHLKFYFYPFL